MKTLISVMIFAMSCGMAQTPPAHPTPVPVMIGYGMDLKCDQSGCLGRNAYWTGNLDKSYVAWWPKGWSPNWKDARQYNRLEDYDLAHSIPNGGHCCYSEYVTPINPQTGEEDWSVQEAAYKKAMEEEAAKWKTWHDKSPTEQDAAVKAWIKAHDAN